MPTVADIWINDMPFMLEGHHEGLATSANPAAVGVGGGGEFKDYTQWSMLALNSWALGAGYKDITQGGFLYSETDTRFTGKIKLPPLVEYAKLDDHSDCAAYFAEDCGKVYMGYGNAVYLWDGDRWDAIVTGLGECVTGLAMFDEYLHIGQGANAPYHYYSTVTGDEGDGPYCADGFYAWGGFLYSWCCNMIRYTNGGHSTCDEETVPPNVAYDPLNPAPGWQWTEIQIGPCDACECINGMAGTFLGSLGQSRLYVSTPSQLYAILPGDIVMSMISWSGADIDNGRGMVTYNGSAYAPVGDGLFRIAGDGSIIQIGINNGDGLPCDVRGKHKEQIVTNNGVLSLVDGKDNTVWLWANGWHYITRLPGEGVGGYYSAYHERLFLPMADGNIASLALVDQNSEKNRYAPYGYIDLGVAHGGLRLAEKDFHDVIIDGDGISNDTPVAVYWSIEDQDGCTEPERKLLGYATSNTSILPWPCGGAGRPHGKRIRLWLTLSSKEASQTPVVRNVVLRFLPHVIDQSRWHYTVLLDKDCMIDACGTEVEGYSQKEWDCAIRRAIVEVTPVKFRDFDGSEYYVKVMDWVRRIHGREIVGDSDLKFNISWALTLVQVCPDALIVC